MDRSLWISIVSLCGPLDFKRLRNTHLDDVKYQHYLFSYAMFLL
jgi:hypothetical protein